MAALLGQIEFWWWWALAAGLMALEILAPGVFFLWFAASAGLLGLLLLLWPTLTWEWQLILFGLLGVAALAGGRAWLRRRPLHSDQPLLNRRGQSYLGRRLTLPEPIVNGTGWARVDDSRWRVEGPDLPAGSLVEVVGVEGATLRVRPL